MKPARIAAVIGLLIALRFVVGAFLPLSADEAYYWLWSKHLASGYFDHPPAIAFVIRFGTAIFGDTSLGVRFGGLLLSIPASWFVWRSAAILSGDETIAARACLFFNLTLMIAVETMAATPDAPSILTSAAFVFFLVKVQQTQGGRWWLAAGIAAGLGLLAKYTAFFLGAGALAWLFADKDARRWLWSPWPYLGGGIAALIFAPNIFWNEAHGWMTFAFQFGRIGTGHLTARFVAEFIGAQLGLASPFIFLLAVAGLVQARRDEKRILLAALIWPSLLYFLFHALRDRVQGNWPCYLYPAFAILAAMAADGAGRWKVFARRLAAPVALLLLLIAYAQALFGVVPLGHGDLVARLLGKGFAPMMAKARLNAPHAAILTSDYETTAWTRFYTDAPVIAVGEDYRYQTSPAPPSALFGGPLLYVAEQRVDRHEWLAAHFASVVRLGEMGRYNVYRVQGLRGPVFGKAP
ncbi:MAG TPA: glycosyltransferase family 39 protein [Rhizomicrobium sp.]